MQAQHKDSGKIRLSLNPPVALQVMAEAMEYGAIKYEPWDWMKGFKASQLIDSALRHIISWQLGKDLNEESGVLHLGHAMANLAILIDTLDIGTTKDDRPVLQEVYGESLDD